MSTQLIEKVKSEHKQRFNKKPVLVAAPGRINLIGEHTDYNKGMVFPASINKYIVCAISKSEEKFSRIYSIDMNEEVKFDLNNFTKQKQGCWKNYVFGVINELQKRGKKLTNFNLVFGGNIPVGAGLSSSAALENSIVFAFNELYNLCLSKDDMVLISMKAEHNFADVNCGIMDQFSSMKGKADHALFLDCENMSCEQVPIKMKDYQFVLINTNVKHKLADSAYNKRKEECNEGLRILRNKFSDLKSLPYTNIKQLNSFKKTMPQNIYQRCLFIIEENERVKLAKTAIENNQLQIFGQLMFDSHYGLQHFYEVSCSELDFLVEKAKKSDAVIGSRMMGGGFGGCTLNLIKSEKMNDFIYKTKIDYLNKFERKADVYEISIVDGTHKI